MPTRERRAKSLGVPVDELPDGGKKAREAMTHNAELRGRPLADGPA